MYNHVNICISIMIIVFHGHKTAGQASNQRVPPLNIFDVNSSPVSRFPPPPSYDVGIPVSRFPPPSFRNIDLPSEDNCKKLSGPCRLKAYIDESRMSYYNISCHCYHENVSL